jgi:hypothetical protein
MKTSANLLGIILALSVGTWTFFYFLAAGDPLSPPETLVVVGICAGSVFVVRWVLWCLWGRRGGHADES